MRLLLTDQEKEILGYLDDILKFGDKIFNDYLFDTDEENYKKKFIAFHFGAIHNYSEAIYILCKNKKPQAATVLLRSIFEGFVNMVYFVNTNSNRKIAKYAIEDAEKRLRVLNELKTFVAKYPKWKNKYSMTNENELDRLIIFIKKNIQALKLGNKSHLKTKIETKLIEKAKAYDKKIRKDGDWELNYILFYKFSSTLAHLSLSGIENFLQEGGTRFDTGGSRGVQPVLVTVFGFYVAMLNYVRNRNYIPNKIKLTKYNKYINKLQKK